MRLFVLIAAALAIAAPQTARAQPVATVADATGPAEAFRAGAWTTLGVGDIVSVGEKVRTAKQTVLRLVFSDSVVVLGADSEVRVKECSPPGTERPQTLLELAHGKLRALVAKLFSQPGARFSVLSGTAEITVRGTEFVAIYDPVADVTDVVGVSDTTQVHSVTDRARRGVSIGEREMTRVERGRLPSPPRRLDETMFRQYLEGLDLLGGGGASVGNALITGTSLPAEDRSVPADTGADAALAPGASLADEGWMPHPMAPGEGGLVQPGQNAPVTSQPPASVGARRTGDLGIDF